MRLTQAFRIEPKDVVALVGGGGKTEAMFRLADELAAADRRVVTTTTTRIFAAQIKLAPYCLTAPPFPPTRGGGERVEFLSRLDAALALHPHTLVISETNEEGKAFGVPAEMVDDWAAMDRVDAVIYEADGSRMRPFKAPASHEPVLTKGTTLLVPVVGMGVLGASLDDEHVHRAERVAAVTGAKIGDPVTVEMIARVLAHPQGGMKDKPSAARAIALVNAVESAGQLESARQIARLLLESGPIQAVAIGAVKQAGDPVRETHRRVAAIITAAGAGTRMEGRIKQLLPWRGKTLIENAIGIVAGSSANEIVVVLGAHAEEIRQVIREPRAAVVVNHNWEEGHASSIRAGLSAISPSMDAAIFVNADQPLLTSGVVDAIIQRYRETDAPIVAPTYGGKRGSPALFRRVHFDEMGSLSGEQGGRELIAKYADRVERVEFQPTQFGVDVDTLQEYEKLVGETSLSSW